MFYLAPSSTAAARASQAMARPRAKAVRIEAMFSGLVGVVGMANKTNRLANGYPVPIDKAFV
jgi:hypothetical protein